jgi:hypothetical protein
MNETTRQALEASIAHWRTAAEVKAPGEAPFGCANCALCRLFRPVDCDGCPVAARSGRLTCAGTPYGEAIIEHHRWIFDPEDALAEAAYRAAARREIEFLESLREPGEP